MKFAEQQHQAVEHPLLDRVRACSSTPDAAAAFFTAMLHPEPSARMTSQQALTHPYLRACVQQMQASCTASERDSEHSTGSSSAHGLSSETHRKASALLPMAKAADSGRSMLSGLKSVCGSSVSMVTSAVTSSVPESLRSSRNDMLGTHSIADYFPKYVHASSDAELSVEEPESTTEVAPAAAVSLPVTPTHTAAAVATPAVVQTQEQGQLSGDASAAVRSTAQHEQQLLAGAQPSVAQHAESSSHASGSHGADAKPSHSNSERLQTLANSQSLRAAEHRQRALPGQHSEPVLASSIRIPLTHQMRSEGHSVAASATGWSEAPLTWSPIAAPDAQAEANIVNSMQHSMPEQPSMPPSPAKASESSLTESFSIAAVFADTHTATVRATVAGIEPSLTSHPLDLVPSHPVFIDSECEDDSDDDRDEEGPAGAGAGEPLQRMASAPDAGSNAEAQNLASSNQHSCAAMECAGIGHTDCNPGATHDVQHASHAQSAGTRNVHHQPAAPLTMYHR